MDKKTISVTKSWLQRPKCSKKNKKIIKKAFSYENN